MFLVFFSYFFVCISYIYIYICLLFLHFWRSLPPIRRLHSNLQALLVRILLSRTGGSPGRFGGGTHWRGRGTRRQKEGRLLRNVCGHPGPVHGGLEADHVCVRGFVACRIFTGVSSSLYYLYCSANGVPGAAYVLCLVGARRTATFVSERLVFFVVAGVHLIFGPEHRGVRRGPLWCVYLREVYSSTLYLEGYVFFFKRTAVKHFIICFICARRPTACHVYI